MPVKNDIKTRVAEILAPGDYTIQESGPIPGPGDNRLTFGNSGVRFNAVTLYIDMRGSTRVLNEHRPQSVAKIHKAYLFIATKLISDARGQIRSYNGDSILAFFAGNGKAEVSIAAKAALQIRYMLTEVCASEFARYRPVDFGIGLDVGQVLCAKAGMGRNDNHNDLIWLGNSINRATVLSDKAHAPHHLWASSAVRDLLDDSVRFTGSGYSRRDVWSQDYIQYNGATEYAWKTDAFAGVE